MVSLPFRDRKDAGTRLAVALAQFRGLNPLVVGIPRGGLPIGRVVADALGAELDVVLVRKIGAPGHPEYAVGSIDEQGSILLGEQAARSGANDAYVRDEAARELQLIRERRASYSANRTAIPVAGRIVIVVDDGLATGSTMIAALKALRTQGPERLVCAVPVAASDSLAEVSKFADQIVCLATPRPFYAVSPYYADFSAVTDAQVKEILAAPSLPTVPDEGGESAFARQVHIPAGQLVLPGDLMSPPSRRGLIIFAHGSGSSRHSPRNRSVASALNRRGYATLLFDLLTVDEDRDPRLRFDIPVLALRLEAAIEWAQHEPDVRALPLALFGASTGAAAAIVVAAARPGDVAAVVSRGGRPDLAGDWALSQVCSHTLLIVGSADEQVLQLNRTAAQTMGDYAHVAVIAGATHLFEEVGALEQIAPLAADWFDRWLQHKHAQAQPSSGSLGAANWRAR